LGKSCGSHTPGMQETSHKWSLGRKGWSTIKLENRGTKKKKKRKRPARKTLPTSERDKSTQKKTYRSENPRSLLKGGKHEKKAGFASGETLRGGSTSAKRESRRNIKQLGTGRRRGVVPQIRRGTNGGRKAQASPRLIRSLFLKQEKIGDYKKCTE